MGTLASSRNVQQMQQLIFCHLGNMFHKNHQKANTNSQFLTFFIFILLFILGWVPKILQDDFMQPMFLGQLLIS